MKFLLKKYRFIGICTGKASFQREGDRYDDFCRSWWRRKWVGPFDGFLRRFIQCRVCAAVSDTQRADAAVFHDDELTGNRSGDAHSPCLFGIDQILPDSSHDIVVVLADIVSERAGIVACSVALTEGIV